MTNQTNTNQTKTIEGDVIMKDYKEMKWVEIVAYAKEMGINTGHKKRIDIEAELDALANKEVIVPAGDMSSDKYYPEEQTETKTETSAPKTAKQVLEEKILAAINHASFDATYNNQPVRYIMTKSLFTVVKYNLPKSLRNDNNVNQVIAGLIKQKKLYNCKPNFYGVF